MGADSSLSGTAEVSNKENWSTSTSHIVYHFGTSGLAVATATMVTHPLEELLKVAPNSSFTLWYKKELQTDEYDYNVGVDRARNRLTTSLRHVLKVRLQMQLVGQRGPLIGIGRLCVNVWKNEGPKSMYLGLTPALTRSILYGGLRLGLYEPSKNACDWAFGSTNVLVKIASGAFAGATATALTNPTEVLKVRLQMNANRRQGGPITEMRRIVSEEGISALWKGVGPAMARASALTASQLATYDESKLILVKWTPLEEGFPLHLVSSTVAGIVSTLVTAPMDMIKTRLMMQRESGQLGNYKNGIHCVYQVVRTEGAMALYKGGFAVFARLGPQSTITFILCEKLRQLAGLNAI